MYSEKSLIQTQELTKIGFEVVIVMLHYKQVIAITYYQTILQLQTKRIVNMAKP